MVGKKCKQLMTRSLLHHQFSVRQVGDGEDCFYLDAHYCGAKAVSSVSDSQTGGEEEEMGGGWSRRVGETLGGNYYTLQCRVTGERCI